MFVRRLADSAAVVAHGFSKLGRRFAKDADGATAVEFGVVALPFFMVLCAIFESAFLLFSQGNLENATYAASRQLLTGQIQSSGQTSATQLTNFQNLVCASLWSNFHCANIKVDVQSASSFTNSFDTTNDFFSNGLAASFAPGSSGQVVVVRVGYPYPLYFNRMMTGFSSSTVTLMATTVFKAENY